MAREQALTCRRCVGTRSARNDSDYYFAHSVRSRIYHLAFKHGDQCGTEAYRGALIHGQTANASLTAFVAHVGSDGKVVEGVKAMSRLAAAATFPQPYHAARINLNVRIFVGLDFETRKTIDRRFLRIEERFGLVSSATVPSPIIRCAAAPANAGAVHPPERTGAHHAFTQPLRRHDEKPSARPGATFLERGCR